MADSSPPRLTTPQPTRHPTPTVKARKLAYLSFELPDLDKAERYLLDFGLVTAQRDEQTLYMRSADSAPFCYRASRAARPRFIGFGLQVESLDDLKALTTLPGATGIHLLASPGGGHCVRLLDPSGFIVEAVTGQVEVAPLDHRPVLDLNVGSKTPRVNATQRPPIAPPEVLKLGHVVLEVADFQATCAWYTRHFGFIPSDVQVLPDGSPGVVFMRLDLDDEPADHHTLAMAQGFMPCYSHSAYWFMRLIL